MEQIERVWEYSLNNPHGFTLNIEHWKPVKYGIVVAYADTQNSHGKESLQKVIDHAREHSHTIGGWLDSESGKHYFDSVKTFPNHKLKEALDFAKANEQIAIFDLTNLREIRVEP